VQRTLSLFALGFGCAQLVAGPLSDRYGRRPVLLAGLAIYVLASAACAAAGSIDALSGARVLQAIGCCTAVVLARAIIRDAYAPQEGARIVAQASNRMALAPLLGPIAGAYLQVAFDWRAAFLLLSVLGLVLALVAWRGFRETNRQRDPAALQPAGLRANHARVLRAPAFWSYALPGALSYASIFVFLSGGSYALIEVLHLPTAWFGFAWALGVSGFLSGTAACRRLLARRGPARTLSLGAWLALTGGLLFAGAVWLGADNWATVIAGQFLVMFAHGVNWPCAQAGAVNPFPRQAGTAAGLLGFFTMLCAWAVGNWIGWRHDGTLLPMASAAAVLGVLIFALAQWTAHHRHTAN
jgi:DHA1 family bicyclomycin/chloramphenicol resistance-like MFS transporter